MAGLSASCYLSRIRRITVVFAAEWIVFHNIMYRTLRNSDYYASTFREKEGIDHNIARGLHESLSSTMVNHHEITTK